MIKSLELTNFQSHKKTKLNFSSGLNVIIGNSRSGKTACMRAINWNRYNRPIGNALISFWDRNKNKQPETEHSCSITFDTGDVITRIKQKNRNGYDVIINDVVSCYNAIDKDVPEDIEKMFNMNEVNIQKQFDSPFMVAESNAEIARFLNKTISLDIIDHVLSNAERLRQQTNKEYKNVLENFEKITNDIGEMSWLDIVDQLISSLEEYEDKMVETRKNKVSLSSLKDEIEFSQKQTEKFPKNIDFILDKISQLSEYKSKIEKNRLVFKTFEDLFKSLSTIERKIQNNISLETINRIEDYRLKITEHIKELNTKKSELSYFKKTYENIERENENISNKTNEIDLIKKSMPEVCPLCGNRLGEIK